MNLVVSFVILSIPWRLIISIVIVKKRIALRKLLIFACASTTSSLQCQTLL